MEFQDFLKAVMKFEFLSDIETANAAVKAVLGLLTSNLEEPQARELTQRLPGPLSYEKLHNYQKGVALMISVEEYITEIGSQFGLNKDEAGMLIGTVLQLTKESIGNDAVLDLKKNLPPEWTEFLQKV